MMNSFLKYSLVLFLGINTMYSQTTTNQHKVPTTNSSALLDMSEIDEKLVIEGERAKGFVLPVVEIDNLLDTKSPIDNPAEGLMVYNQGKYRIAGVYMFKHGMWSAIVNRGSSIENAVVTPKTLVLKQGQDNEIFVNDLVEFDNTFGDVVVRENVLNLLPGQYLISLFLNGELEQDTNIASMLGDTRQAVRGHLINILGTINVGGEMGINKAFSDVMVPMVKVEETGNKYLSRKFFATFYFAVVIEPKASGDQYTKVRLNLKIDEGTTYTQGTINIDDTYINVEKSLL